MKSEDAETWKPISCNSHRSPAKHIGYNQLVWTTIWYTVPHPFILIGPSGNLSRRDTKKGPVLTVSKAHNFLAKSIRDHYFYHFRENHLWHIILGYILHFSQAKNRTPSVAGGNTDLIWTSFENYPLFLLIWILWVYIHTSMVITMYQSMFFKKNHPFRRLPNQIWRTNIVV